MSPGQRLSGRSAPLPPLPGIAWSQYDDNNAVANVFVVTDATLVRLTPNVSVIDEPVNPVLSPDRTVVAFRDFDPDGNSAVYVVPVDGSATDPLDPDFAVFNDGPSGGYWIQNPSWHPAGSSVLFTSAQPEGSYTGLTDGGKIVEASYPAGTVNTLWLPDLQSPTQREEGWRPVYSPDGSKIAFFVNVVAGGGGDLTRQGLWVMDADGSNPVHLDRWDTDDPAGGYALDGTQAAWSNDSQWLAYSTRGYGGEIYKIKTDGTGKTLLMSPPASDDCFVGWGAWTADDSQVYVTSFAGVAFTKYSVYLAEADGSGDTEIITNADGPIGSPRFAQVYQLDDRLYWCYDNDPAIFKSSALDGTDIQTYYDGTADGALLFGCTGIECN